MMEQDAVVDYVLTGSYVEPEPKAYEIIIHPKPGTMFVIKHVGEWYLQTRNDLCFGQYEWPSDALNDKNPTGGRTLEELPTE